MCLKKTNTHSALSWPLAIGFLKVCPVLSCFSVTYPRTFVEGSCPLQPLRPRELEVPLAALGWAALSPVWPFATPWTVARQAPLSMGFPRREYWGGLPFPSPRDHPDPGIECMSPALQVHSLPLSHLGSPYGFFSIINISVVEIKGQLKFCGFWWMEPQPKCQWCRICLYLLNVT